MVLGSKACLKQFMVKTLSSTCLTEKRLQKHYMHIANILLESALTLKLQQMLFSDGKENTKTPFDIMTAEYMEQIEIILSSDRDPLETANAELIKKLDIWEY